MLDTSTVLRVLNDLADMPETAVGGATAASSVLPVLATLIGHSLSTWNRLALVDGGRAEQVVVDPAVRWVDVAVHQVEERLGTHPLAEAAFTPRSDIVRISDVTSPGQWSRHPLYTEVLRPRDVPAHSVFVPLTVSRDEVSFLMLNRDRDFTDNEVDALRVLQGGLTVLLRTRGRAAGTPLSAREVDVLELLAGGYTVSRAAHALGISPRTAAKHVESIHHKLGTQDRVSTVRVAMQQGLIHRGWSVAAP